MSIAERQIGGCFNQCLGQGILSGPCGITDYACICSSAFINGFETCISSICTSGDIPSAQQSFVLLCGETGHHLSTSLTTVVAVATGQGPSATLSHSVSLPSDNGNPGSLQNNNLKVDSGIPLGRIIGPVVGGVGVLLIIMFVVFIRIRSRRRVRNAINTLNMVQAPNRNFQTQSPPTTAFQSPPTAPDQNPPYMPLSNPSTAWTRQDTAYISQVNTPGYGHGSVYPGAYPTSTSQGYGNSFPDPSYPIQSNYYVPPDAQTPVSLEYPGPTIDTQSFNVNIDEHNYYPPPATSRQPPQSTISSYFSSDVKTPLTSTSEHHLLGSAPGVPQSASTSSPPFISPSSSTQSPSIHPATGDGATGFHITNSNEMDGSDDVSRERSARESIQPGSDGQPSGGFRIANPDNLQPRAGGAKGSSVDSPPVYTEKATT